MTTRLGWYYSLPVVSGADIPGDKGDQENYDFFYAGSESPGAGNAFRVFFAGVNNEPGGTGTVVWTKTWTPVVSDPAPTTSQPFGVNPGMLRLDGDNAAGTYELTATFNGVPVPGKLVFVQQPDPSESSYGMAAWSYVGVDAVDFEGTPLTGDAPLTTAFTDLSTGSPSAWAWDFGDGGTSTLQNPSHEYSAAGTYTVALTATFGGGPLTETKVAYVVVTAPPPPKVPDFVGVPLTGLAALTVQFNDLSTGGPVTAWSWSFGDSQTSNVQNPQHTYIAAGAYTVSLTATIDGVPSGVTKVAYVNVTAPTPQTEDLGMTTPVLPISRLINVSVNLTPKAAAAQNLSTLLILGTSSIIDMTERYRVYAGIDAIAADFGTTAPEYLAAVLWFEQVPQPSNLIIGRWAKTASAAVLKGATLSLAAQALANFTAVTTGKFTYTKDGGSAQTTGALNFSGAANLPAVAALINAQTAGVTFTWNSYFQRFEAVDNTTGATAALSFLSTPGSGTDISGLLGMRADQSGSYTTPGADPETAVDCVAYFELNYGMTYYGVTVLDSTDADHLAVAPFLNATTNKHIYFVTTQEAGVLVAATTSDIASQLKALGYLRTWVQFSSSNPYAAVSAAARILTTDYTGNSTVITLMYKQEPGIVAESLNVTQADALEAKNCNVFVNYNNDTAIIEKGVTANGTFLDIVCGTDWLALTITTALYNLLYLTKTKIPQTDAGSQLMVVTIEAVCDQGVRNGLLAPGTWTNTGFGNLQLGDFLQKGYYVYAPKVALQNVSDRAKRKAIPIQVAAKLAGAVHTIAMSIDVNQ